MIIRATVQDIYYLIKNGKLNYDKLTVGGLQVKTEWTTCELFTDWSLWKARLTELGANTTSEDFIADFPEPT